MVQEQIASRGIRDARVLDAMRQVPRHLFVPERVSFLAYSDGPIALGYGQTISQPYIVALMTEALEIVDDNKVLEIGTGSGYQAAILSRLAREVFTIERIGELADEARERLAHLQVNNVRVIHGNGTLGLPQEAPFDAVIVTAAGTVIPEPLIEQLKDGGQLVAPVGERWEQTLIKLTKKKNRINKRNLGFCSFVPLITVQEC